MSEWVADTILEKEPSGAPYITLGGGCFWCVESEFRRLKGVVFTVSGYQGGTHKNPSYQDICTGNTGHAEVTKIYFNPDILPLRDLLIHFLTIAHDPTQLNGQGVDIGTQYRSVIFYQDSEQESIFKKIIAEVNESKRWQKPIVTMIEPESQFWSGEEYHQQYYETYEQKRGVKHPNFAYKIQKWSKL